MADAEDPAQRAAPIPEALQAAQAAYEAGDFRRVRELVTPLLASEQPEVASGAAQLIERIGVDPVQAAILAACLLLFVGIVYAYL